MADMPQERRKWTKYPAWPEGELEKVLASDEVYAAFYYEYAREVDQVRERIAAWRGNDGSKLAKLVETSTSEPEKAQKKKWEARLLAELEVYYTDPWHDEKVLPVFPPALLASFPEFPDKAWFEIKKGHGMRKYWAKEASGRSGGYVDFSRFFEHPFHQGIAETGLERLKHEAKPETAVMVISFDWNSVNDDEILWLCQDWVRCHRPGGVCATKKRKSNQRHFRGEPLPFQPTSALKWLDALRALDKKDSIKAFQLDSRANFPTEHLDQDRFGRGHAWANAKRILTWFQKGGPPPATLKA